MERRHHLQETPPLACGAAAKLPEGYPTGTTPHGRLGGPLKRTAGVEMARPSPSAVTDTCRESPQGDSDPTRHQPPPQLQMCRYKDAKTPASEVVAQEIGTGGQLQQHICAGSETPSSWSPRRRTPQVGLAR